MQVRPGYFLKHRQLAAWLGVFVSYGLFALWALGPRLNNVLSFGGDDGFELCKALLVARRPDLAPQMWNDQPWLHTMLNAALFRLVGEHAVLPRMFSLVSLGALLSAAVHLLRGSLNFAGGLALGCFLLAGEGMPNWSVAAMLELPAISWAMLSAALAATPPGVVVRWRMVSAGALLALACHIKFTALVLLPALLLMVWVQIGARQFGLALVWASLAFVTVFSLLVLLSPSFDLEQLVVPHAPAVSAIGTAERAQFYPQWVWILGDPAPLLAAVFAMTHSVFKRCKSALVFTLVLFCTAVVIALGYRPWWPYYLIHLQAPIAMLGAVGVTWLSQQLHDIFQMRPEARNLLVSRWPTPAKNWPPIPRVIGGMAAVLALWSGFALPRTMSAMEQLNNYPTAQSSQLVAMLRCYHDRIRWCYTELRDIAFHGGVLIPPELIVLSHKRFWHGDLDERRLWNWVRLYAPEAIIVTETYREQHPICAERLEQDYVLCVKESGKECWLARSLNPVPLRRIETRLERFNL